MSEWYLVGTPGDQHLLLFAKLCSVLGSNLPWQDISEVVSMVSRRRDQYRDITAAWLIPRDLYLHSVPLENRVILSLFYRGFLDTPPLADLDTVI